MRVYLCLIVRRNIDDIPIISASVAPTCTGSIWGVLNKPIKIEFLKSLTKGNAIFALVIHLPSEVV